MYLCWFLVGNIFLLYGNLVMKEEHKEIILTLVKRFLFVMITIVLLGMMVLSVLV